jgi:8-amino-7-oxononanoate synthase
MNLDNLLNKKLEDLASQNLLRKLRDSERLKVAHIIRDGKKYISFSCNDYLGLANDERLKKAAIKATEKYGVGAGASRLITGNNPLYTELENIIAKQHNVESAAVFGSGYMANLGAISALMEENDLIIADKLSHSCIIEGAKLSGAEMKRFLHNDLTSLENLLSKNRDNYKNCLVVTEAVFSMDGDAPNLQEMANMCKKYDAWLMIDYAHDLSHFTSNFQLPTSNLIIMGTLSKAIGAYGGYIAGSQTLIDYLKTSCKTLMFTTALPPSVLATCIESYTIVYSEKWRVEKALDNAKYFIDLDCHFHGNDTEFVGSQIVPIIIGEAEKALEVSTKLYESGFLVHAIRPPTVPTNTSRLRFSFSALHERKDIEKVTEILGKLI